MQNLAPSEIVLFSLSWRSWIVAGFILVAQGIVTGQTVTHLYVEPFGSKTPDPLREETIKLLKSQKEVLMVPTEASADRVLSGTNQTYIKGYIARNPRVRYRNGDSRPIYGGYLSVELKDQHDETVWSYLVTPARFGAEDINKNLAEQVVDKLVQFLKNPAKTP